MVRSFDDELERFGPKAAIHELSEDDSLHYCKKLTLSHYENFNVAGFLLPKELRSPFHVVYSYCRWADDLADEHDGTQSSKNNSLKLLDWWEQGLDDCFDALSIENHPGCQKTGGSAGRMETDRTNPARNHPVFKALRRIAEKYRLPREPFADLLTAFRRDQIQCRYETLDDLLDYCRCSANPVGRIVLYLVYGSDSIRLEEHRKPDDRQLAWSDSICTGLQLANFWQDVARDARMGRCYLPREIAERFGVDPNELQDSAAFRNLIKELVEDARQRLRDGIPLVASVPRRVRLDIALFLRGGLAILDAIEKNGYNVLVERPTVSRWSQFRLLLETWWFGMR